ncbi:MAG: hypothetical protein PHN89_05710, partial [Candidatus Pacebacteria bacterium]|nr:hypothetical protein [Candidatus Paceibacterota bacterium]
MKSFGQEGPLSREVEEIRKEDESNRTSPEGSFDESKNIELREKLARIKEKVSTSYQNVAKIILEFRSIIEKNPDISRHDLIDEVYRRRHQGEITDIQAGNLIEASHAYASQHETVEEHARLYPEASALYEACFGKKPKGRVEMKVLPICFYIQCYDSEDYAFARAVGSGISSPSVDDVEKIPSSIGCALSKTRISDLNDAVTLENTERVLRHKEIGVSKEIKEQDFIWDEKRWDYAHLSVGDLTCDINCFPEEKGKPNLIAVFNLENGEGVTVERVKKSGKIILKVAGEVVQEEEFVFPLEKKGVQYGEIVIGTKEMRFRNTSGQKASIGKTEYIDEKEIDQSASEMTRIHEEQHIFNRLFKPASDRPWLFVDSVSRGEAIKDKSKTTEILRDFFRLIRAEIYDQRARDEI